MAADQFSAYVRPVYITVSRLACTSSRLLTTSTITYWRDGIGGKASEEASQGEIFFPLGCVDAYGVLCMLLFLSILMRRV